MNSENENIKKDFQIVKKIQNKNKTKVKKREEFDAAKAIDEFEELKNIALNCFDKNGNPNVQAAIRALENKAKIAGLYSNSKVEIGTMVKMDKIQIDGEQLKLNIGEDLY